MDLGTVQSITTARKEVGWCCFRSRGAVGLQLSQHSAYFTNERDVSQAPQPRVHHIHIDQASGRTVTLGLISYSSHHRPTYYVSLSLRSLVGDKSRCVSQELGNPRRKREELQRWLACFVAVCASLSGLDLLTSPSQTPSTTCKCSCINIRNRVRNLVRLPTHPV